MPQASPFFIPPLEPEGVKEAYEIGSEQDLEVWEQTSEATEKALGGFWELKPGERMRFYDEHEPLTVTNVLGQKVLAGYWQVLMDLDPQETMKMVRDWKGRERDREKEAQGDFDLSRYI